MDGSVKGSSENGIGNIRGIRVEWGGGYGLEDTDGRSEKKVVGIVAMFSRHVVESMRRYKLCFM